MEKSYMRVHNVIMFIKCLLIINWLSAIETERTIVFIKNKT